MEMLKIIEWLFLVGRDKNLVVFAIFSYNSCDSFENNPYPEGDSIMMILLTCVILVWIDAMH